MRRRHGFTLIELMVVIVILGGLIALLGPNVFQVHGHSNRKIAETQLSNFATAIQSYRLQARRLPGALADLTVRTEAFPEPYITSIPKDPWDNAYEYRVEGPAAFSLRSAGLDGVPGSDDDLVWPLPER